MNDFNSRENNDGSITSYDKEDGQTMTRPTPGKNGEWDLQAGDQLIGSYISKSRAVKALDDLEWGEWE